MIEITPQKLLSIGIVCFSIVVAMGLINYVINFNVMNIWGKIGTAFNIFFQIALALSFIYLKKITPDMTPTAPEPQEDLSELIKEASKHARAK